MVTIVNQNNPLLPNPVFKTIAPPYFAAKYVPTNREEKRRFDRECEKAMEHIMPVEFGFIAELFNEENFDDYIAIFNQFNNIYRDRCDYLKRTAKFKFIIMDEKYFFNEYNTLNK